MDYTEIERRIACIEKQLSDVGKYLIDLGQTLKDSPAQVAVGESIQIPNLGWSATIPTNPTSIPLTALDVNLLRSTTEALTEATREREHLLQHLQRMGLQNLAYQPDG